MSHYFDPATNDSQAPSPHEAETGGVCPIRLRCTLPERNPQAGTWQDSCRWAVRARELFPTVEPPSSPLHRLHRWRLPYLLLRQHIHSVLLSLCVYDYNDTELHFTKTISTLVRRTV